ncbi:MAG: VWA domain-containing protein [Proteobacteria bacterium]|nr:VWA domain-containing protein [Pseudomonadota bacterium]
MVRKIFQRSSDPDLGRLKTAWKGRWEEALGLWSRYTKLSEPVWCSTRAEERRQGLKDSFAMIRLDGHVVAVSLRQVRDLGLEDQALEILAHEIGHHVYTPADLRDNARLLARVRHALPTVEVLAGFIANLYADLLINDRLARSAGLDMAAVYRKLKTDGAGRLWRLYTRIMEVLWNLPSGTLAEGRSDERIDVDATLGARVVRAYAREWLDGAGRFAALFLPYLIEEKAQFLSGLKIVWMDALGAGAGGEAPDGLVEIEDGEIDGAIHPAEDDRLTGLGEREAPEGGRPGGGGREDVGGRKNQYREPAEYVELMKSLGVRVSEEEMVIRYYRERARPHLVRFPVRETRSAEDPLPEGLDPWDPGDPLAELDWTESLIRSPTLIPGLTTYRRTYGRTEGGLPGQRPLDLYVGVDCSGSMMNPRLALSFPVLAGAIVSLSALRAGARVMVCLSGEPGSYSRTDGFVRDEKAVLKILTGYLGTGYAFGIRRLKETFLDGAKPARPTHVLVVSDSDIFRMLSEVKGGWDLIARTLEAAGGGGTMVLNIPGLNPTWAKKLDRLRETGWLVHLVSSWDELLVFARGFSKTHYELCSWKKGG